MEKITKKHFIELLCNNGSVFAGSVFKKTDEWIIKALEKIEPEKVKTAERRTVTEKHDKYIVFSNGSRSGFDQDGKYECYEHMTGNGGYYIIQRLETWDRWDNEYNYSYVIYAIPDLFREPDENEDGETITTASGKTYKTVDRMPDGWKVIDGATAAIPGYKWIYNGEARFKKENGKYIKNPAWKTMLLRVGNGA